MAAVLVLVLTIFSAGFYLSVMARKHVFDTIGFTLFALFFAETVALFEMFFVLVYGPSGPEKAGTIFLLAFIGLIGAVFFLTRVRTDEIRRAIEDAQRHVNFVGSLIDGGEYWVKKLERLIEGEAVSNQGGSDTSGAGTDDNIES